jgi:hypothetical protein
MKRVCVVAWVLLLAGVCLGTPVQSNGKGGGKWSAGATWAGGVVPVGGDTVSVVAGDTVTFDADMSNWTSGIAGLTCNGTLQCSTTPGSYHLKTSADIGGTGAIVCGSAGAAYPGNCTMTFNFDSKPNSFECGSGLVLNLFCRQPVHPVVTLLADAGLGQKGLPVDTDVRQDIWAPGSAIRIDDASGNVPDSEAGTIAAAGVAAGMITVQAGLAYAKGVGAEVMLVTRNIRIIGSTDWAVKSLTGGTLACEISNCSYGVSSCSGTVISGVISGCIYGVYSNSACTFSGLISGCTHGIDSCLGCAVSGVTSGCIYGVNAGSGCRVSGVISGCMYGLGWSPECMVSGTISGCTSGIYASSGKIQGGALRGNTYDLRGVTAVSAYNTTFSGTTDNYEYNTDRVPQWGYAASYDHDAGAGNFKAWTGGGVVVSDVDTVPPGYGASYKHTCKSAAMPCFREETATIEPGQTLSVQAEMLILDDHSAWAPRIEIIDAGADPLIDASKVALASTLIPQPKSRYAWQHVTVSCTNSGTLAKPVLIRCSAQRATGDVYEVWTTHVTP